VATFERSLSGCIGNTPSKMFLDDGALTACTIQGKSDQTSLQVTKTVEFDSSGANVGAYVLYMLSNQEFVDSTAELACCRKERP